MRLLALGLVPLLPLLLGACGAMTPDPVAVKVSFASDTYDGAAGHGVRVIVRLDKAPGRAVAIPLVVTGGGDHRLFEWEGPQSVRSVGAVSFVGDENEKTIFVQSRSSSTISFGSLPDAVAEGRPSSADIGIFAARTLDQIDNLQMPHPAGADYEDAGTLEAGQVAFGEFAFQNENFLSVTAMSWKETDGSTVPNLDARVSYVHVVDASTGTETLRLQIPVDSECPDRKNPPPRDEWPCVIDDIADTEAGSDMVRRSNHIMQARLNPGRYQLRVEAADAPGPYRATIHYNEEVICYIPPCPVDED